MKCLTVQVCISKLLVDKEEVMGIRRKGGRIYQLFPTIIFLFILNCRKPPTPPEEDQQYDPRNISRTEGSSTSPKLDIRDNRVVVVWDDSTSGNWEIYYRERRDGEWGEIENISESPNISVAPQVVIDIYGNVHVVWEEDDPGAFIYYRCRESGSEWGEKILISEGVLPQIGTDSLGNIYIVWQNGGLWYKKKTLSSWEEAEGFAHGWGVNPAMAVSSDGHVYVVAEGGDSWYPDIYFYERSPDGEWTEYFNVTDTLLYCWVPDVYVDGDKRVYVSWTEYGMNSIGYRMREPGGTWQDKEYLPGITGGPWFTSIFGFGDTMGIVWSENRGNWEVYYRLKIGNGWGSEFNVSNTEELSLTKGRAVKIINGILHIVWTEGERDKEDIYYDEILLSY